MSDKAEDTKVTAQLDKWGENPYVLLGALSAIASFLLTESFTVTAIVVILVWVMIFIYTNDDASIPRKLGHQLQVWFGRVTVGTTTSPYRSVYDLEIGYLRGTNNMIFVNLAKCGHILVAGLTGKGKTVAYHNMLSWLLTQHTPEEIQIVLADMKRHSYNIWVGDGNIRFFPLPIAKNPDEGAMAIQYVYEELERREELFDAYRTKRVDTLEKYNKANVDSPLPRLILMIDELADLNPDEATQSMLNSLVRRGRGLGITVIAGLQRPSAGGMGGGDFRSQFGTVMVGYMKAAAEYGNIAQVPPYVYKYMKPEAGLFMFFTVGPEAALMNRVNPAWKGWGFIKTRYESDAAIEKIAASVREKHSYKEPPQWPSNLIAQDGVQAMVASGKMIWRGSREDKIRMIGIVFARYVDRIPTQQEVMDAFIGMDSRQTAGKWMKIYQDSISGFA